MDHINIEILYRHIYHEILLGIPGDEMMVHVLSIQEMKEKVMAELEKFIAENHLDKEVLR